MRPIAKEAAKTFISHYFPTSSLAILGGSILRGEETPTSDLDIIILDETLNKAYRESFFENGWPIEAFIHNRKSIYDFMESDCKRGRPSMPKMLLEGIVLKDITKLADQLKEDAKKMLLEGPEPWTAEQTALARYSITDLLDDLEGSREPAEDLFIVNNLAYNLHEFILRTNRQWIGQGKWIVRALRNYDQELADRFVLAFDSFYLSREKRELIAFTDQILDQYGGRLFEGFSLGKD
ncbi:nucleotidyltransferase domain-containing protein [Pseudalkalibacillus caeni]|uniref:Nucleotidyltransferase domain-containing protein n=1 Tax=Exobacillus caeni TaxID=2574798 RepID=A0A5R9FCB6_9BACL|nr:nucleotidyltransferase domain-containing protein [Pseudalkalibacillus caeni]TLS38194.1 nucleotidyltransferase domain-containing protein [Pseudalkalibacillus caeni]